jgi:Protein of unknown function (DUF2012)
MIRRVLLLLCCLSALVAALDITGSLIANSHLPSPALLPASTLLILSSASLDYRTHSAPDGHFAFRNVTAGPSYLLRIECITHTFPPLRIDTQNEVLEVYQTFPANEWNHKGAKLAYPIELGPSSRADYYVVSIYSFYN